jgi:hypothetical protein
MPISIANDSASISTNEYFLLGDSTSSAYSTTDTVVQVVIDFAAMLAGDEYEVKIYDKVDGTNGRVMYYSYLNGVQANPLVTPSMLLDNWEVSIKRTAGADRTIYWSIRKIT